MTSSHVPSTVPISGIALALAAALMLAACNESPEKTAKDVAAAEREHARDVAAAQHEAQVVAADADAEVSKVVAEAEHRLIDAVVNSDGEASKVAEAAAEGNEAVTKVAAQTANEVAQARYEVALADAKGRLAIAKELCDGVAPGTPREACHDDAEQVYRAAVRHAEASLKRAG